MPPAEFGKPAPAKCSVASPQLLASARRNRRRGTSRTRDRAARVAALLEQPLAREAEHDREQERRRAEQHEEQVGQPRAERPIRFVIGPGWPVDENAGSPRS
jgi:hypothetical protein